MARKPFTVSVPAARNVGEAPAQKPQSAAAAQERSDREGVTLVEAGVEVMTADGEVGGLQEAPNDDGARPVYKPAIPWPAAKNGHKPFKV